MAALAQVGGLEAARPRAVADLLIPLYPLLTIQVIRCLQRECTAAARDGNMVLDTPLSLAHCLQHVKWHIQHHRKREEQRRRKPSTQPPPTKWTGRQAHGHAQRPQLGAAHVWYGLVQW